MGGDAVGDAVGDAGGYAVGYVGGDAGGDVGGDAVGDSSASYWLRHMTSLSICSRIRPHIPSRIRFRI